MRKVFSQIIPFVIGALLLAQIPNSAVKANPITGSFALQSAASNVSYDSGTSTYPLGSKTLVAMYWTGQQFAVTASGTCNYVNTCNGVTVFVGSSQALLTYVGTNQINFLMPSLSTDGLYGVTVNEVGGNQRTVNHTLKANNMQTFVTNQDVIENGNLVNRPLIQGDLYGWNVDGQGNKTTVHWIKTLHDGNANQRTYNGWPTFIQVYASGCKTPATDDIRWDYNGSWVTDVQMSTTSWDGVYVVNLFNNSGWSAGVYPIQLKYNGQTSPNTAYVYWDTL